MARRKRKQKTPEQRRKQANRRQRILQTAGRALFLLVLVSAALLALTVFFKVDAIEVEGMSRYTALEIENGMDIKTGDNLYLWNKVKVADHLLEKFPYLETVQIRRHLPDKLVVTVSESQAVLAVPADAGFYLLSEQGKVLELSSSDGGLPVATGVTLMGMKPGQMVDRTADAYTDALLAVLDAGRASGMLNEVDFINLQSLTDVRIGCMKRFDIRAGTIDQLEYRLRFAQTVIAERLSPSDIGRLYWDGKERLHFVPDTAENVARSATTLEAAPPDPPKNTKPQTDDPDTAGEGGDNAGEYGDSSGEAGDADLPDESEPDSGEDGLSGEPGDETGE
ncbi:cell division protein FtsQ/DivIB [Agathobaculum sp.]|uniref:cell division protein FtsQ/DivIB n=1 Tax=Agathobaculum sp. TaxID=2048138 RepID=UPI002A82C8B0|nr:FtsQ-type POTRA domain-containing protein [Agathobaculum sp.]MDY3617546.1 FtsQ-type POTRA domain-containing protein [Agathobaculum sp.]